MSLAHIPYMRSVEWGQITRKSHCNMGNRVTWLEKLNYTVIHSIPMTKRAFILLKGSWVRHRVPTCTLVVLLRLKAVKRLDTSVVHFPACKRCYERDVTPQGLWASVQSIFESTGHAAQFIIKVVPTNVIAICSIFISVLIKTTEGVTAF